jgi:predicted peptidase
VIRTACFCVLLLCILGTTPQLARAGSAVDKDDLTFKKEVYADKLGAKMPYRLYVPESYDSQKKYPLVFWLHGAAGRGSDNVKPISGGNESGTHIWIAAANQSQFPAFVLAPQCPEDHFWSEPELNEITPELQMALDILGVVEKEYSIDTDRVYAAGQSMGGLGVWALLQNSPDRWAAGLVLCAYDNFTNARALLPIPIWVFQGDADMIVPVDLVRTMTKDLKKAGSQVRYSEYHKVGHEVWLKAFAEPELVSWVAKQKRHP